MEPTIRLENTSKNYKIGFRSSCFFPAIKAANSNQLMHYDTNSEQQENLKTIFILRISKGADMKKCIYCSAEIHDDSVIDFCEKCGVRTFGRKMFDTIVQRMNDARDKGDIV